MPKSTGKKDKNPGSGTGQSENRVISFLKDSASGRHASWQVPLFLAVLTGIFFFPVLTLKGFLWNDFTGQYFPYRVFAGTALKNGNFPFWTPFVFSGLPFFADIQTAVLYPFNLILTLFVSGQWLSPVLCEYQIILHVFLAGYFTYILARDFAYSIAASLCAAISFMFCGFLTMHVFHMSMINTAVWLPLATLFLKRGLEKKSLFYSSLLALLLGMMFLAGHPQVMVYTYYWLGLFFMYKLWILFREDTDKKTRIKKGLLRTLLFGGAAAGGIGIASIQLLPTLFLGETSTRPELALEAASEGAFRIHRFLTLLVPDIFGNHETGYWGLAAADYNPGTHYYWETMMYTGIITLLLALAGLIIKRNRLNMFLGISGIILLLFSMGDSFFVFPLFYKILPGIDKFRDIARVGFILSLIISLLAASGIDSLIKGSQSITSRLKSILEIALPAAAGVSLLIAVLTGMGMFKGAVSGFILNSGSLNITGNDLSNAVDNRLYPEIVKEVFRAALLVITASLTLLFHIKGKLSGLTASVFITLIIAVDLISFGYGFAANGPDPSRVYKKTPLIRQLQEIGEKEFYRFNSRDSKPGTKDLGGRNMIFRKNQGNVHRIFLIEGMNPLRLNREFTNRRERTFDLLNVKYKISTKGGKTGITQHDPLPRAWMAYNWRVIKKKEDIESTLYDPGFDHTKEIILEENPVISEPEEPIDRSRVKTEIISYSINEIEISVETPKQGMLLLSEIYYPAWKAEIDGNPLPLYRADYALRAVPVEEGNHTVRVFYNSSVFNTGRIISAITLLVLLSLLTFLYLRNKKQHTKT